MLLSILWEVVVWQKGVIEAVCHVCMSVPVAMIESCGKNGMYKNA